MNANSSISVYLSIRKSICLIFCIGCLSYCGYTQTIGTQSDTLSRDTISQVIESPTFYSCHLSAIGNPEIKIDYVIAQDSVVTFCISHSLTGDSLLYQSYSLQAIACINKATHDTVRSYESNMTLKQFKRVYAGAQSNYFLTFPIEVNALDSLELQQDFNEGPLQFPPMMLKTFPTSDSLPCSTYLSDTLTGTVAFYTRQRFGPMDVFIDGNFIGTIQQAISKKSESPDCGDIGENLVNARVSAGKHLYTVRSSKFTWEGEFQMLRESCIKINIEK